MQCAPSHNVNALLAYIRRPHPSSYMKFLHESTFGEIKMTRIRNTYTVLAAFVSTAVLLISTAAPASASSMTSGSLSSPTTTAVRAQVTDPGTNRTYTPSSGTSRMNLDTSVGDPIVTAYWTPERMKNAIPADTLTSVAEINRQVDKLGHQDLADDPVTDGSAPVAASLSAIAPQTVTPVTNFGLSLFGVGGSVRW